MAKMIFKGFLKLFLNIVQNIVFLLMIKVIYLFLYYKNWVKTIVVL